MRAPISRKQIFNFIWLALTGTGIMLLSFREAPAQPTETPEKAPEKTLELSLEDVTRLALENSLDIQIAKFDAYIKRTSLEKAESLFDTFLNAQGYFSHNKKMQPSSLLGSDEKEHGFSVGLEKKLPTATTLTLDAMGTKSRSSSSFVTLNPFNEAETRISLEQSLGRNFFGLADRASIKITKLDIENSDFSSLDDMEKSLADVQQAYWDFVLKDAQLVIAEEMFKSAETLYKIYQDKFERGLTEESELLALEALVSTRYGEVIIAELEKETAKNNLFFLMNSGSFEEALAPKDNLTTDTHSVNLYEEVKEAIVNRRDYKRKTNELKSKRIEMVVNENALWPEINLEASFSRNHLNTDRGKAWEGLGNNANDEVLVELKFKMPLENREARADLNKTNLEREKLLLGLKKIERLVLMEVHDAVNHVNITQNQVSLYESIVKMHEKKLDKEIERLNYGRSDADTLIRYEEDLLESRRILSNYWHQYRRNLIELERVKNSLLDRYWQEPL
ncbi:MAG: TolC family protein [Candidatus Omnitrophota bacterium]